MRVVVALLAVACAVLMSSCREPVITSAGHTVYLAKDCQLHMSRMGGVAGEAVADTVSLYRGQRVQWCNRSDNFVTLIVSDPKIFGGRRSIRLAPGECVWIRVGTGLRTWKISWRCWRMGEDGEVVEEGGGASPGKTDDPPPPPPGASPGTTDDPPTP
jgi:hypothetical protein